MLEAGFLVACCLVVILLCSACSQFEEARRERQESAELQELCHKHWLKICELQYKLDRIRAVLDGGEDEDEEV